MLNMGAKKLSIALDERVAEAAAASAEPQGLSLSAWLNRGAQNALAVADGLAAVAELGGRARRVHRRGDRAGGCRSRCRSQARARAPMTMGTTYDTGALLAAEADRRELWVLHARSLQRGERPVVPAAVLAQAWRGGPQAALSRLLRGCVVEDLDEPRAGAAGIVCARSGARDIVDAIVVAGALARAGLVVTSDSGDLERLPSALGSSVRTYRI